MDLQKLTRPNVWQLKPYSCARNEFQGEASVYLDANESPYGAPYNRYPDPLQLQVKKRIGEVKNVSPDSIFLGNGSDEPIDLLYRAFCEPKEDNVVAIEPTYGMYRVCADINNVEYRTVALDENFQLSAAKLLSACDAHTKLVWLCSPNNPSGNRLDEKEILDVIKGFDGLVILDEAYIDFSAEVHFLPLLHNYPNLVILQTFSKAWASAAIRLGMAFASPEIVGILTKIKYPYNINILTQQHVLSVLENHEQVRQRVADILVQRDWLHKNLLKLSFVEKIYPSDANFLLVKVTDANTIYRTLIEKGIVVRNRSSVALCNNCLRITVGTPEENAILYQKLATCFEFLKK